jgi:hypothetical protein
MICGWWTWIRTKIDGVKVRCSTVELSPTRSPQKALKRKTLGRSQSPKSLVSAPFRAPKGAEVQVARLLFRPGSCGGAKIFRMTGVSSAGSSASPPKLSTSGDSKRASSDPAAVRAPHPDRHLASLVGVDACVALLMRPTTHIALA